MARSLGEAYVSILPDTAAFREKAQTSIKKALEGVRANVNMGLDDKGLAAEAKAATKKATAAAGDVKIGTKLDDAKLKEEIAKIKGMLGDLSARAANIQIDAKDKAALATIAKINAKITELSARSANIKTDVNIATAMAKVAAIDADLDKLAAKHPTVKVDVDRNHFRTALASLGGIGGGILRKLRGDFEKDAGDTGNSMGLAMMKRFGAAIILQSPGITALVVASFAALPALVGVAGLAGGVALGAGIMAGAILMIDKQQQTIATKITSLTSKATSSANSIASKQLQVQNTEATIARLSATKNLTAAQQQQLSTAQKALPVYQQQLAVTQQNATASQKQLAALKAQQAQLAQQKAAYTPVINATKELRNAFYNFATTVTQPLIKPFTNALKSAADLLNGPFKTAFTDLFSATAPLVQSFVTMISKLVLNLLPGLTQLLLQAGGPIEKIVTQFGALVGLKLADWFRAAIPYIKDSGTYLLGVFNAAGNAVTALIKLGGLLSVQFVKAGPALKPVNQAFDGLVSALKPALPLVGALLTAVFTISGILLKTMTPAIKQLIPPFTQLAIVIAQQAAALTGALAPAISLLGEAMAIVLRDVVSFLAKHPAIVKAILAIVVAWKILTFVMELNPFVRIAAIAIIAIGLIIKYWKPITAFFKKLWEDVLKYTPMGALIRLEIWAISEIVRHWSTIVGFFHHLWSTIANDVHIAWSAVANFFSNIWQKIYNFFKTYGLGVVTIVIRYHTQIKNFVVKVWNDIKNAITGSWNWLYAHVFGPIGTNLNKYLVRPFANIVTWINKNFIMPIRNAFQSFIDDLPGIWSKFKSIIGAPVKFVIQYIYDDAIVPFWNNTIGALLNKHLGKIDASKFATGGQVPGSGSGDTVHAMLTPGEVVVPKGMVKAGAVDHLRGKLPGFAGGGQVPDPGAIANQTFPGGANDPNKQGFLDPVKKVISGIRNLAGAALAHVFSGLINPLIGHIPGANSVGGKFAVAMAHKVEDAVVTWIKGNTQVGGTKVPNVGSGVARWRGIVDKVLRMEGLNLGLDSRVLAQIASESGGNPNAQNNWDVNAQRGDPSRGLLQTIGATFRAYHWPGTSWNIFDPTANIAAAVNYARHVYGPSLMANGMGIGSQKGYATGGTLRERAFGVTKSGMQFSLGESGNEIIRPEAADRRYQTGYDQTNQLLIKNNALLEKLINVQNVNSQRQQAALTGVGRGLIRH